jgi:hypothetical protein
MGLTQIIPPIIQAWQFFGYKEDVHFTINKRPLKKWGWETPFINPRDYEHVIAWFNGSIILLISQDRPGSSNSISFDTIKGDEAKFLDYEKLQTETFPALSGSIQSIRNFREHPRFKSRMFVTDMPIQKKSQWILDMKKEMEQDLINLILYYRKKLARTKNPRYINYYTKCLNKLRAEAVYYSEASALDNIRVLGEKYIKDQKRSLEPFKYRTQILNLRPDKIENGFYHGYDANRHDLPVSFNNSILDQFNYDFKKINDNDNCLLDNDLNRTKPLVIAEDHNADINSLIIGQPKYDIKELWFLKSMYVKMPFDFADLMKKFISYYKSFPENNKEVIYYYDSTSIRRSELTKETNKDMLCKMLSAAGWKVTAVYLGNPEFHDVKYDNWNYSFKGERGLLPKYNKFNCYDCIIAMQQTGIKYGHTRTGWEKDKSQEHKYFDTEETQPHLTDAMDTLKRGCEQMPVYSEYRTPLSNIYGK